MPCQAFPLKSRQVRIRTGVSRIATPMIVMTEVAAAELNWRVSPPRSLNTAQLRDVACASALKLSLEHRARSFCYEVVDQCLHLRTIADKLESLVDDALWPLPKYRELLFMV